MLTKPDRIFDREFEWRHLSAFVERGRDTVQLGVVSGRRRQGKTFLLEALASETGGFYFGATQATEAESLRLFSAALQDYAKSPVRLRFADWDEAIRHLFTVAGDIGRPIVIDEFPYLSKVSPALPSIIQREVDRAISQGGRLALLLCGSAMSVMGGLLAGSAPLRGRATLELVVKPFDYPLAAGYWKIGDPALAARVHAVVGGTPAYLRFLNGDIPESMDDFDEWVLRTVLDPGTPLFREARYLLEEETDIRDSALYHSVLAAVAAGDNTRGGIASYIGRKAADIGHHLNVLEDNCLLRREPDVFRAGRSVYRVAEPLISFYQVIMRPQWGLLESGRAAAVWTDARPRFHSQIMGPHFEELCRRFALVEPVFGGLPGEVGAGALTDHAYRTQIQVDVAVFAPAVPGEPRRVMSIGEVKWGDVMGARHVERLRRARDLLAEKGYDTRETVLACYSGAGFDPAFHPEDDVRMIGLPELYS
ncbi:ATPase AAA [Planobispora rosea]|uniref:ATPase AAA n=1 Tax=Planobispora rosea TaxID=35762 RepID=A0A8J3RX85_PLARO|nr:ATP-binding protein [Planobispora rosea]GGS58376.1 ATPase AAA [Planobispora rosea]GIH84761.1 ATPase AAA [Planobispora rosea]